MQPVTFVGIDLTDAHARVPRPVDVAILDAVSGDVAFRAFEWPARGRDDWAAAVAAAVNGYRRGQTVFVVDGPQALSEPGNDTRDVERCLGTPAHTPCTCPEPGSRPFAGYIRTSLDFFNALVGEGFRLAELSEAVGPADLFEAYPGAVWPRLFDGEGRLHSKSTAAGREQRRALLAAAGCRLPGQALTHDQLDAAVCAALGWRFFHQADGQKVSLARDRPVYRDPGGTLREGRMLVPDRPARTPQVAPAPKAAKGFEPPASQPPSLSPSLPAEPAPSSPAPTPLPRCDWVYFAAPSKANRGETYDLAFTEELISRTVYNTLGNRINQVSHLRPGHSILLAYGKKNRYTALLRCVIDDPAKPLSHGEHQFPAFQVAEPAMAAVLAQLGYSADPILQQFTVVPLTNVQDLSALNAGVPKTVRDAIRRWEDVFGP